MSGTVVLIRAEHGRLVVSDQCFDALAVPSGAKKERYSGNAYVMDSRNAVAENFKGDWLCMIDDDHVYKPSLLLQLLRHFEDPKVDIVTPILMRRDAPHGTMLYRSISRSLDPSTWAQVQLTQEDSGLIEIDGCGASFILIRRRVFEALSQPYFHHEGHFSEDLCFCSAAKQAGLGVYCDLNLRVGHLVSAVVWPYYDQRGWSAIAAPMSTVGRESQTITNVLKQSAEIERPMVFQRQQVTEKISPVERTVVAVGGGVVTKLED